MGSVRGGCRVTNWLTCPVQYFARTRRDSCRTFAYALSAAVSCCLAAADHALHLSCNKYAGHCAGFSVRIPVLGLWYLCAMLSTSVLLWLLASCTGDAK
jgi:hypothetical protein